MTMCSYRNQPLIYVYANEDLTSINWATVDVSLANIDNYDSISYEVFQNSDWVYFAMNFQYIDD